MKINHFVTIAALALSSGLATAREPLVVSQGITEQEVLAAQKAWCGALVDISAAYEKGGQPAARSVAEKIIDSTYGYQLGPVLFKPTLTMHPQTFRTTRAGALSYFVGGDPSFPGDTGFALKGWTKCETDNAGIFIAGDSAASMGKVHLTDKEGQETSVDKTWVFVKDDAGALRMVVHHSSLEYRPGSTP